MTPRGWSKEESHEDVEKGSHRGGRGRGADRHRGVQRQPGQQRSSDRSDGKVATQDDLVSIVTASGEIKPTTYTNVTAQGFGRITAILVKEGDHIKKGDRLLLQENVQASADVQAQSAAIHSAESGVQAADASYSAAKADLVSQQANMEKAKLDWERGQGLFKDGLIPKQDFDQRKSTYDGAVAAVDSAKDRVKSLKAATRPDRLAGKSERGDAGADQGRIVEDHLHLADKRNRQLPTGARRRLRCAGYSPIPTAVF